MNVSVPVIVATLLAISLPVGLSLGVVAQDADLRKIETFPPGEAPPTAESHDSSDLLFANQEYV